MRYRLKELYHYPVLNKCMYGIDPMTQLAGGHNHIIWIPNYKAIR